MVARARQVSCPVQVSDAEGIYPYEHWVKGVCVTGEQRGGLLHASVPNLSPAALLLCRKAGTQPIKCLQKKHSSICKVEKLSTCKKISFTAFY